MIAFSSAWLKTPLGSSCASTSPAAMAGWVKSR